MDSMPLRIDGALINEARTSGQIFHRSIAQQLEHWATLGRALEAVLTVPGLAKLKMAKKPADLDLLLARASSPAGQKRILALLAKKKGPLYGSKPNHPDVLLQYARDGTKVAGRMVNGAFVPSKTAPKVKTRASR
jgi:ParD-like antitoxin of type II bacterial toxin-antitoxin system